MKPVYTPDRRYLVVGRRLWRATNPNLSEDVRAELVRKLMRARREVRASMHADDSTRLAAARAAVNAAKIDLGERGPVWWADSTDFNLRLVENTPYADWYLELAKSCEPRDEAAPD